MYKITSAIITDPKLLTGLDLIERLTPVAKNIVNAQDEFQGSAEPKPASRDLSFKTLILLEKGEDGDDDSLAVSADLHIATTETHGLVFTFLGENGTPLKTLVIENKLIQAEFRNAATRAEEASKIERLFPGLGNTPFLLSLTHLGISTMANGNDLYNFNRLMMGVFMGLLQSIKASISPEELPVHLRPM